MIDNFLRRPSGPGEVAADAVRALGVLGVLVAAVGFTVTDAGILALALPALVVPRFLGARASFDIAYGVTVLVAAWSNVLELYTSVPGWDLVVHFACTAVLAAMAYLLLAHVRVVPAPAEADAAARIPIVLVPVLGLAASAVWEMIEWLGHAFVTDDIFVTYDDTIGDMVFGGLGALAAGIVVSRVGLLRASAAAPAGHASITRP